MSHFRERWLSSNLLSELKWSPAVGIFGLRQVGKTTLVESIVKRLNGAYETLDREITLHASREAPMEFCTRKGLLCVDEAQKGPWIFSVIKEMIGTRRRAGRFLLTGSVRFTAKKEIRESLTGRILLHELLPFSMAEASHEKPASFLRRAFESIEGSPAERSERHREGGVRAFLEKMAGERWAATEGDIVRALERGGLPVPCFARNREARTRWFEAYFETMLARDVVLIDPRLARLSLRQSQAFLQALALHQGREISLPDVIGQSSLRPLDAKRLLESLEVLALIDRVPPEQRGKKSVRSTRLEWKDAGLWSAALGITPGPPTEQAMRLLLSQELRSQLHQMHPAPVWTFYRSRDGAQIPWIFRRGMASVALTYLPTEVPEPYDYRALKRFLDTEKQAIGFVIGSRKAPITAIRDRVWLVPYSLVF